MDHMDRMVVKMAMVVVMVAVMVADTVMVNRSSTSRAQRSLIWAEMLRSPVVLVY